MTADVKRLYRSCAAWISSASATWRSTLYSPQYTPEVTTNTVEKKRGRAARKLLATQLATDAYCWRRTAGQLYRRQFLHRWKAPVFFTATAIMFQRRPQASAGGNRRAHCSVRPWFALWRCSAGLLRLRYRRLSIGNAGNTSSAPLILTCSSVISTRKVSLLNPAY